MAVVLLGVCLTSSAPTRSQTQPQTQPQPQTAEAADQAESSLLAPQEVEALVARIAFYPDEVIAVTLPASTYPLDVVEATRFLDQKAKDPKAQPNPNWDPSISSLLNYPVVLRMMNDDLSWTRSLGTAVLNQQGDVMDAIQQVRKSAYTEGDLKSNDKANVIYNNNTVQIEPTDPEKVYVPIYQPAPTTTVVNQPYPVYYPTAYSEPYYPYYNPAASFWTGALMGGMTMGFLMNWDDDDIDVDFHGGDWDNWNPGRGDVNINGDVNIGNNVLAKGGDSWRNVRDQRARNGQAPQVGRGRQAGAQPLSNTSGRRDIQGPGQRQAGNKQVGNRQAGNNQVGQKNLGTNKARQNQGGDKRKAKQNAGAFDSSQRGQNAAKASQRGKDSRAIKQQGSRSNTSARQNRAAPQQSMGSRSRSSGGGAFAGSGNSRQAQQFSNRGRQSRSSGGGSRGGGGGARRR